MNIRKLNVPLIYVEEKCSKNAEILKLNVVSMLELKNIPYIILKDKEYVLNIMGSEYNLKNIEEVMYISRSCIVIEAGYTRKARYIVDKFVDAGFDVLCFPSNISNKYAFFSNNLIRDGATCITSYYMLLEYLTT